MSALELIPVSAFKIPLALIAPVTCNGTVGVVSAPIPTFPPSFTKTPTLPASSSIDIFLLLKALIVNLVFAADNCPISPLNLFILKNPSVS